MIARLLAFGVAIAMFTPAHATFAGACYAVHGRLSQANGNPSLRIWPTGTKRMLGVVDCQGKDESPNAVPDNVKALAGAYVEAPVFGDFEVCPFDKERPGAMQKVCIRSASHLVKAPQ